MQGRELFIEYNCYGCHGGLAGGAMGPSLRDTTWKYGGSDSLIYHSIHDGRPMGMPPWAGRLNDRQIGAIIEYIHSLRTKSEPQFFFAQGGDTTAAPAANAAPPASPNPIPMPGPRPGHGEESDEEDVGWRADNVAVRAESTTSSKTDSTDRAGQPPEKNSFCCLSWLSGPIS